MAEKPVPELIKRSDSAWHHKQQWESLMREVYDYFAPERQQYRQQHKGERKNDRAFDSTPITALTNFANRIQSDLTPPGQNWAVLQAGPGVPQDQQKEVNDTLDQISRQMFTVLQSSNWDNANNECLHDLGVGTGAMLVLEGPDMETPVRYVAVPQAHVALEEGPWGSISGVFRKHKVAIRNIEEQWPGAELTDELERRKQDDPDAEVELLEVTYSATDTRKDDNGNDTKVTVWYYDVIWRSSSEGKDGSRLVSWRFRRNPWVTPRWIKLPGETYGRGPAVQALPDAKTLNKLRELVLKNAALQVHGVYTVTENVNPANVRIQPGAQIPVTSNGGTGRGPDLMPLQLPGNFDLGQIEEEKLRMHIKEILLDDSLPPESGPVRSATEIVERIKQLAKEIGAPYGRLITEYLQPVMQRTLDIMEAKGLISPVSINGTTVQVQVQSKLAMEQQLNDVEAVTRWLSLISSFGSETLILSAVVEKIGPWLAERLGVPSELVRDQEQQQAIQRVADRIAQQQLEAQTAAGQGGRESGVPTAAPSSASAIQTGAQIGGAMPPAA